MSGFLTLKPQPVMEDEIENWDDDDLDIGGDDFTFRSTSVATTTTNAPSYRDSISSRLSARSDFESNHGDEPKHLHFPGGDEEATTDAIAAATRAGIPLPNNVPSSALVGGTIKRLGGRKIKKVIQDDWDDDLELPRKGDLKVKRQDGASFPESLRQVSGPSSAQTSPSQPRPGAPIFELNTRTLRPKAASRNLKLERFRDSELDDDFFGDGGATIKVPKIRTLQKPTSLLTPPTPQKQAAESFDDDFEADLQLPSDGALLKLSARKDIPRTPISLDDDFDEWDEGSLGTRFGGTKRDARSNRSSSVTALSPSVGSTFTAESEDEGLDGLVLPSGPLHFDDMLKKRKQNRSPDFSVFDKEPVSQPSASMVTAPAVPVSNTTKNDDFFAGLDIGDGDVFDNRKLTLNRNIKVKSTRQNSPGRPKTAVALTFTNKPSPPANSRLPRLHGGQDRVSSQLEPVSESGNPIKNRIRLTQSRPGHSAQSSISSIPTPSTPSSLHTGPQTPRRRELGQKASAVTLRPEPTTTSAQLLKLKRSMPILRANTQLSSKPAVPAVPAVPRYERPPSRADSGSRPLIVSRPKTPTERERGGSETSLSHAKKNPLPFLPAGASQSQSQHITVKSSRTFRRHDSELSNASGDIQFRPSSRAVSRSTMRSPSPVKLRLFRGADALAREAAMKRQVTKPVRRRHFGDGLELDGFDDLPTSQQAEQKFIKQPVGRGAPKSLLAKKLSANSITDRTTTPLPTTPSAPFSPAKGENVPRFARDTNASRMAREQVLAQRGPSATTPLTPSTAHWKIQLASRPTLQSINTQPQRSRKSRHPVQKKPHLIKHLGDSFSNAKSERGMRYNPSTFRWEGNENELSAFDVPDPAPPVSPLTATHPHSHHRDRDNATPRPALITNASASHGVQIVGRMVFDPQRMCWLKIGSSAAAAAAQSASGGKTDAGSSSLDGLASATDDDDEEEDVFKDVPDLEDSPAKEEFDAGGGSGQRGESHGGNGGGAGGGGGSGLRDEWLVGEEFDVGPEFIRRQREEEERWRRKCSRWGGAERTPLDNDEWRWIIRDVVGASEGV